MVHELSLKLLEKTIPIFVKRRARQKNIHLKISRDNNVELSYPYHSNLADAVSFAQKKAAWILKHLQKQEESLRAVDPLTSILFLGKTYPIEWNKSSTGSNRIRVNKNSLVIATVLNDRKNREAILKKWLKRQAKKFLLKEIERIAGRLKISFQRLSIRDQKSRWGSSSGKGVISINFRIIMAPLSVIHYLFIHELLHQKHPNHSKEYWNAVEQVCPNYKVLDQWLRKNAILMNLFRL